MLKANFFVDVGMPDEMQQSYYQYDKLVGKEAETCACKFMRNNEDFQSVLDQLHQFSNKNVSVYTLDLMFLFSCTGYLYDDYKARNVSDEIFINTMKDILYKTEECRKVKNVFGVFTIQWYEGFLKMQRFAFNRLQFDIWEKHTNEMAFGKYQITPDQFSLNCHIPSSGPLDYDAVIQSYQMAYEFFKEKITDGILPIFCNSWLLYPLYKKIFKQNSPNITKFISDFKIYESDKSETFFDAWRIFGMDYDGDTFHLPRKTRLQKGFIEYINSGGSFGTGKGVLLFDGKNPVQ